MPNKVLYERVNLADIETSSDEDDYGDLFAQERRNGHGKSRPLRNISKKKAQKFSFCCQGFVVITSVLALLATMAGVALYMDPEGSGYLLNMGSGNSTEDIRSDNSSGITLPSVLVINSTIANSTVPNLNNANPIKANSTITNSNGANATITRAPEATKPKLTKPAKNTTDASSKKPSKASGAEKPGKSEEALSTWSSSALTSSVESSGRLRARLS